MKTDRLEFSQRVIRQAEELQKVTRQLLAEMAADATERKAIQADFLLRSDGQADERAGID